MAALFARVDGDLKGHSHVHWHDQQVRPGAVGWSRDTQWVCSAHKRRSHLDLVVPLVFQVARHRIRREMPHPDDPLFVNQWHLNNTAERTFTAPARAVLTWVYAQSWRFLLTHVLSFLVWLEQTPARSRESM